MSANKLKPHKLVFTVGAKDRHQASHNEVMVCEPTMHSRRVTWNHPKSSFLEETFFGEPLFFPFAAEYRRFTRALQLKLGSDRSLHFLGPSLAVPKGRRGALLGGVTGHREGGGGMGMIR